MAQSTGGGHALIREQLNTGLRLFQLKLSAHRRMNDRISDSSSVSIVAASDSVTGSNPPRPSLHATTQKVRQEVH